MRLLSMHLGDERFAGGTAQLEFSQLTALWGPNDAGKTTLLFRVHDVLAWLTGRRPNLVRDAIQVGGLVVELGAGEADRFALEAARDLDERSPRSLRVGDGEVSVSMALPSAARDALDRVLREGGRALGPWLEFCLSHVTLEEQHRRTLREAVLRRPVL